jgi:hypothetical protein
VELLQRVPSRHPSAGLPLTQGSCKGCWAMEGHHARPLPLLAAGAGATCAGAYTPAAGAWYAPAAGAATGTVPGSRCPGCVQATGAGGARQGHSPTPATAAAAPPTGA